VEGLVYFSNNLSLSLNVILHEGGKHRFSNAGKESALEIFSTVGQRTWVCCLELYCVGCTARVVICWGGAEIASTGKCKYGKIDYGITVQLLEIRLK